MAINKKYLVTLVVYVVLILILAFVVYHLRVTSIDHFGGHGGGGHGGRGHWGGRGGRGWNRGNWGYWGRNWYSGAGPYYYNYGYPVYDSPDIYVTPPTNYGSCKCDGSSVSEDKCLYGKANCDGGKCICGKDSTGYYGCNDKSSTWCQ